MKMFLAFLILILMPKINFADTQALGELIFVYKYPYSGNFNLSISTSNYCWDYINSTVTLVSGYTRNKINITSTYFDAPKSKDSGGDNIVWGLMTFTLTNNTPGQNFTTIFNLDLRDENWSTNSSKYPSHDTYIEIDPVEKKLYITRDGVSSQIYFNGTYLIWQLWNAGSPLQTNFSVPVTLKNRIESGPSTDFGTLWANYHQVTSGSSEDFRFNTTNNVQHYTTEITYNDERKYSFKWSTSAINAVANQNYFSSNINFTIPNNPENKDITRNFRTVHPLTIKNLMPELGSSTSAGEISFKDPTTDNSFHEYSAAGNGYVKNEAFANLIEDIGDLQDQKYSIKAVPNFNYNSRNYYWFSGDYNPNSGTDIIITAPTIKSANYKGTQLSSDGAAFSNNGQRRFIETKFGSTTWLHQVYSSMDRIWLEHSSDGGITWFIGNDGQPVNGSSVAKNPSIAFTSADFGPGQTVNYIGIIWQEKYNSNYRIKARMCTQLSDGINIPDYFTSITTIYNETRETYSGYNANPNLVLSGGMGGPYLITIEKKVVSGAYPAGINWFVGYVQGGGGQLNDYFNPPMAHGLVGGTNGTSTNVQLSKEVYQTISANFIYQQGTYSGGIYTGVLYFD